MSGVFPDEWFREEPDRGTGDLPLQGAEQPPTSANARVTSARAHAAGGLDGRRTPHLDSVLSGPRDINLQVAQPGERPGTWSVGRSVAKTHDVLPEPSRRRRWAPVTWIALLVALGGGIAGGEWLRAQDDQGSVGAAPTAGVVSSVSTSTSTGGSGTASADAPYRGRTALLHATSATATCTAPDAVDVQGNKVTYAASEAIDSSLDTAWRCQGSGVGQSLTFNLPSGTTLVGVGLVNGYVKSIPNHSSSLYYSQYRRNTAVKWTLSNGAWFSQTLLDNHPAAQDVLIPATTVSGPVTLTIVSSTTPGEALANRNAVLISDVVLLTRAAA